MRLKKYKAQTSELNELTLMTKSWDFWSLHDIKTFLKDDKYLLLYLEEDEHWLGCAFYFLTFDVADLLFIYVNPEARGQQLGRMILNASFQFLSQRGLKSVLLEVRTHNMPAIKLYESLDMKKINVRKSYYKNGDDAFVYQKSII